MRRKIFLVATMCAVICAISSALAGAKYEGNVLKTIRKDAVTDRQLVVKFLQRPLSADVGGVAQKLSDGTFAHVQIVAYDKRTGMVVDNFGLTGNMFTQGNASFFREDATGLSMYDTANPLGIVEMSSESYYRIRDRTKEQLSEAYYSPLNKTDLKGNAAAGTGAGAYVGGFAGGAMGALAGVAYSNRDYNKDGRRNYKIVSNDEKQMDFPGLNCQATVDVFLENGRNEPTWVVLQDYHQPGENVTARNNPGTLSDKTHANAIDKPKPSPATSSDSMIDIDKIAATVDTQKLESLLKKQISLCERILNRGTRATQEEIVEHNERSNEIMNEVCLINEKLKGLGVENLSKEEQEKIGEQIFGKVKSWSEHLGRLHKVLESRNLINSSSGGNAKKNDDVCMCQSPKVNVTMPAVGIGWARCDNCGKMIGMVQRDGTIISSNPAFNGKSADALGKAQASSTDTHKTKTGNVSNQQQPERTLTAEDAIRALREP